MKRVVFDILKFLIPLLLMVCVMELAIFYRHDDIFSEKKLDNVFKGIESEYLWAKNIRHKNKVLLIGSSTVLYGIDCAKLTQLSNDSLLFLNFGMVGRDPVEMYFVLKNSNLNNVRSVCVGIDSWFYLKSYYGTRNSYMCLDYTLENMLKCSMFYDKSILYKRYKQFIKYVCNKSFTLYNVHKGVPPNNGSLKIEMKPKAFDVPITNLNNYGYNVNKWADIQFTYLKKIDSLLEHNGIKMYYIITPKRIDYTTTYFKTCGEFHREFVHRLMKLHLKGTFFGKMNDIPDSLSKRCFADGVHLNGDRIKSWGAEQKFANFERKLSKQKTNHY